MFRTEDMLRAFAQYRGNVVVIPGRGGRHWHNISDKPERDVPLGDPAMGVTPPLDWGSPWLGPTKRWCCLTRRATF